MHMTIFSWFRKYWSGLLFGVFAAFLFWALHDRELMNQRAKYTVGYITGWHFSAKNGKYFEFRFSVADSIYEGASLSDKGMATANGSRFVVKYDSLNPETNVGYFNLAIPDSIRQPPRRGWLLPPFPIPRWIAERGKKQ